ncbi:hypothetical protein E4T39_06760 [Aureobasidium subglaciale]|nr:hypothetical protein E4T39_06760 [Aureobasidium subglaciale]
MCCCKRRANRNNLTTAKLVQVLPASISHTAESLGPPPAYEYIEKESKNIGDTNVQATKVADNQMLSTTQAAPQCSTIHTKVDVSSNLSVPTIKSTKRERKRERRQIKREYREEKRDLRAEYRDERRNVQTSRCGPIGMLIKGVSNLMKQ